MLVIHVDRAACAASDMLADSQQSQTSATAAAEQVDSPQAAAATDCELPRSNASRPDNRIDDFEHARTAVEWLDAVVMQLNLVPGFREKVLVIVALGWSSVGSPPLLSQGGGQLMGITEAPAAAAANGSSLDVQAARGSAFAGVRRPAQSFEMLAPALGAEYATVDPSMSLTSPLLVLRRLPAVIRVDHCTQAGVAECLRHGGDGPIAAQHLLPELAFKLGRATKYGA